MTRVAYNVKNFDIIRKNFVFWVFESFPERKRIYEDDIIYFTLYKFFSIEHEKKSNAHERVKTFWGLGKVCH